MATIQDIPAEELARLFHHYHEALTQDVDASGKAEASWDRTPSKERQLMVAAARLALQELAVASDKNNPGRKYFATPGEADWGC